MLVEEGASHWSARIYFTKSCLTPQFAAHKISPESFDGVEPPLELFSLREEAAFCRVAFSFAGNDFARPRVPF